MKTTGVFRVFFNRHGAAPLVWCVQCLQPLSADGGRVPRWELSVPSVDIDGVRVGSVYEPKATLDDEDGKPSAWFVTHGELEVLADGCAVIRAVAA